MRSGNRLITAVMTLAASIVIAGASASAAEAESGAARLADDYSGKTVIVQTNDVHGAISGYTYVAGLKKELERRHADVVLVDCGDYAQGSAYVSEYKGESAVALMNRCGYDYAALGNHEFDYGPDQLRKNIGNGTFRTLCADIIDDSTGKTLCDPAALWEDDDSGLKIGFVGAATPETQTKALPSYFTGMSFPARDKIFSEVVGNEVESLKSSGADLVIALSHLGVDKGASPNRSYDLLNETSGIDLVLDGHSHTVMEHGDSGEPIMSTGTKLTNIGLVVIDEDTEKIESSFLYGLRDSENSSYYEDLPSDGEVAEAAEMYIREVDESYGKVIATSKYDFNGEKKTKDGVRGNRTGETNLGDLLTDAMLWYVNENGSVPDTDADHTVAVFNGGTIRAWLMAGDVTKGDIRNVLPFENTIVAVYVKGSELLEALEASTYCVPEAVGGFPQVSGIEYTIDETKEYDANEEPYPGSTFYGPASINRVSIDSVNGKAFDEDETYVVITNNFCAEGGDTYHAFAAAERQFDTGMSPMYVLTSYITEGLGGVIGDRYKEPAGRISYITEEDKMLTPQNGIPLVIVNVAEQKLNTGSDGSQYGTIADMNGSDDHSVRCRGSVEIKVPDGYKGGFGESELSEAADGSLKLSYIRGRGNSTWARDKKPYKLKFDKKQDLFGMGKNKEWALMANSFDPTLIKNRMTGWLGEALGMEFTPQCIPVDVVMKGSESGAEYLGSYCLSELVGMGSGRVEIDEPGRDVSSRIGDPNITGGYLMTMYSDSQNSDEPESTVFTTGKGMKLINKEPHYDDTDSALTKGETRQRDYIRRYVQETEDLIVRPEKIGLIGHMLISRRLDLESAADYWLVQEFSKNGDAFITSSTYMYKKRNGKLFFGPLWDFDNAWGDMYVDPEDEIIIDKEGFNYTELLWIDELREKDPYFDSLLKKRWKLIDSRLAEMTKKGGVIDQYAKEVKRSQAADYALWKDRTSCLEDYGRVIRDQKTWIDERRAWVNENIGDIGTVHYTVTFRSDGRTVAVKKVRGSAFAEDLPEAPVKRGYLFAGWKEPESGEYADSYRISGDTVFEADFVKEGDEPGPADEGDKTGPEDGDKAAPSGEGGEGRTAPSDGGTGSEELKGNSLIVKGKTIKIRKSRLKKRAAAIAADRALSIRGGEGSLSFRKVAAGKSRLSRRQNTKYGKYFKVDPESGTVRVKKGLKRGTYRLKLRVRAAGDTGHRPVSRTAVVKIRVM